MKKLVVIHEIDDLQALAEAMRLRLSRLVANRDLSPEQIVQADSRLKYFLEDLDAILASVKGK
jgi:hypothetical protein